MHHHIYDCLTTSTNDPVLYAALGRQYTYVTNVTCACQHIVEYARQKRVGYVMKNTALYDSRSIVQKCPGLTNTSSSGS